MSSLGFISFPLFGHTLRTGVRLAPLYYGLGGVAGAEGAGGIHDGRRCQGEAFCKNKEDIMYEGRGVGGWCTLRILYYDIILLLEKN